MNGTPPIDLANLYQMIADGVLTITPELDVTGTGAEPPREVLEAVIEHKPLILYRLSRELAWEELRTWRWGGDDIEVPDAPGLDVHPPKRCEINGVFKL